MKIPFKDITFTIPVRIDSPDRMHNITYILQYLTNNFDTNILVYENGPVKQLNLDSNIDYVYEQNNGAFHRTKYLNKMAKMAKTRFIANYDCDVFFPVKQLVKAYDLLQSNEVNCIYPYDGLFVNINRNVLNDFSNFDPVTLDPMKYHNFGKQSMGGALLWSREAFIEGGMENEKFISWGAEDWERFRRFTKLGYIIGRVKGPLYHIDHSRKQDSNESNPYYQQNVLEFQKVDGMTGAQLREYIKTWPWLS